MFPWRSTMLVCLRRTRRGPRCLPGGRAPGTPTYEGRRWPHPPASRAAVGRIRLLRGSPLAASACFRCFCLQQRLGRVIPSKAPEGGDVRLARREQGYRGDDEQGARSGVGGQLPADRGAEFSQARWGRVAGGDDHGGDTLAVLRVWLAEDGGLADGGAGFEDRGYFAGGYLVAAGIDHFVGAAVHRQAAVRVDLAQVGGGEPAV